MGQWIVDRVYFTVNYWVNHVEVDKIDIVDKDDRGLKYGMVNSWLYDWLSTVNVLLSNSSLLLSQLC